MSYPQQKIVCQLNEQGYFVGTTHADISPLEKKQGIYLLPANTLDIAAPEPKVGFIPQWKGKEGWHYVPDHRGETVYDIASGQPITITEIGDYPQNTTLLIPDSPFHRWSGKAWELSAEAEQQALESQKQALMHQLTQKTDAKKAALLAGFSQTEIESFYKQEQEARDFLRNATSPTPMLDEVLAAREADFTDMTALAKRVVHNADTFAIATGAIIAHKQRFEGRIQAAKNLKEIETIASDIDRW